MVTLVAWNIARRAEAWRFLVDSDADVALLQEATPPPAEIAHRCKVDTSAWHTAGGGISRSWRAAVVRLSDRVSVEWIEPKPIDQAGAGELAVSRQGTLAAAIVTLGDGKSFTVVSMYAPWERPHTTTASKWIYADGSAHRVISDLSALIGHEARHRIVAAGDLNVLHGHGDYGSLYWSARYATVFARMASLGLTFVGPQAPHGRQAEPWPDELPSDSANVPTYYTTRQAPDSATRQLDFVFASEQLAPGVRVTALNEPQLWGPSDHCRVAIEVLTIP